MVRPIRVLDSQSKRGRYGGWRGPGLRVRLRRHRQARLSGPLPPGTGRVYGLKKDDDGPAGVVTVYETTPGSGIGGFDLLDSRDRLFAFDYGSTGTLDHLVCYRPGTGLLRILKKLSNASGPDTFGAVYEAGGIFPGGIGGYDLENAADQIIAYDGDGTGKLDHLVCYRPGTGIISILKKATYDDIFVAVYHGGGIGGYDLRNAADQVIAYDGDGTGKLDHLVCYRPGTGSVWILKKVGDSDSPGAFSAVYRQGDPGQGIGGFDLGDSRDRLLAFDWSGTGKLDHLVCYRPGTGVVRILKKISNDDSPDAFSPVYPVFAAHVAALFAALPDRGANVGGNAARAGLLNVLKGGTPGAFPMLGGNVSYRDVFFPSYAQGPPLPPPGRAPTGGSPSMSSSSARRSITSPAIRVTESASRM